MSSKRGMRSGTPWLFLSRNLGRAGATGQKFRTTLGLPVSAIMNCADNTGAKNLYIIACTGVKGTLNMLPSACIFLVMLSPFYRCLWLAVGDMVMASVKKGTPELRKKGMFRFHFVSFSWTVLFKFSLLFADANPFLLVPPAIIVRQRKAWRRKNGVFLYFEGMSLILAPLTSR